MDNVNTQFETTLDEIDRLDEQKTPLAKRHSKHKSTVRNALKKQFAEAQAEDPSLTELTMAVGNTTFKLENQTNCPSCSVDDMAMYFDPESIEKYKQAKTKSRFKLSFERT